MTSSITDVCNLASDLVAGGVLIDVDSPTTADEELYYRWYNKSRKKVLREHPWNFAIKRALLSASATAPAFGYTNQFPVPANYIRLASVEDSDGQTIQTAEYEFEGNAILYDGDGPLRIRYVYDFTDIPRMDSLFLDLLAHEIALGVAFKVTGSNTDVTRINTLKKEKDGLARAIDGQERPPTRVERSANITARRSGYPKRTDRI